MASKIKCLLVAALFPWFAQAQDKHLVDSLRQALQAEPDPRQKIEFFYQIATENSAGAPEVGFRYADSLDAMVKALNDYPRGRAIALHVRGFAHYDQGEYATALSLFQQELALFTQIGASKNEAAALSNIGMAWSDLGRSDSAVVYYLESIRLDEAAGRLLEASIGHNNLGSIYSDGDIYDKAVEHYEAALRIRQQLGLEKRLIGCYVNLASVYGRMKDLDKAREYTRLGLALAEKYGSRQQAAMLCNNLGDTFNDFNRPAEAIPWLERARTYFTELGNPSKLLYPLVNLSEAYHLTGDHVRALALAREGYAILEKDQPQGPRELYYKAFAEAYEGLGQPAEAYRWYKKYVVQADSIFKQDNLRKVAEADARYENARQKSELAEQQLIIERQQSRQRILLFGALALLLGALGLFQYLRNRQRLRQKEARYALVLEQAEAEKLRALDRVKSSFFANISHEFRTPLTLILGPVQKWLDGAAAQPEVVPRIAEEALIPTQELQLVRRHARRLLDLVGQLLDLSKLESGRMQVTIAEGDVAQLLRMLAHSFESMAEQGRIEYRIVVPEVAVSGWFDRDHLEKIVANLLSNAFKHTPANGIVAFQAEIQNERLSLAVKDTGKGIPSDQLERIFERFYQVEDSGNEPGTGIGLALVKELVSLQGGQLRVESQLGQGSIFRVELPLARSAFPAEAITAWSPAVFPEDSFLEKKRSHTEDESIGSEKQNVENQELPLCLIVEDNRDVQDFIGAQLAAQFRILLASDGRAGLAAATEHMPDLIISDVMMPEMDGNALCAALKTDERSSHIPVILLTARAGQDSKLAGLETGADDYLTKPFDARELLVRARNLVTQRERLRRQFSRTVMLKPQEIALTSADERFLQRIQETLDRRLADEQFSVEELAAAAGMSRSQLHRKLTALIDQPPVEFIRNFRLRRAKEMLEVGVGNVSEVCYEVGFGSPAYFSKAFKEAFGVSPSEVRR